MNKSLLAPLAAAVFSAHSIAATTIEEVVVSSRIPESTLNLSTSVSLIDEQQLQLSGQESLANALAAQPGVGVSHNGGIGSVTTVRIRGEEGFRTQLRIDGVLIADPSAPQVTPVFDDLLVSGVERVEILRGPQGVLYGADAGGVVSITSKRYEDALAGSVDVKAGTDGFQRVTGNVGGSSDLGYFFVSGSDLDVDGFDATSPTDDKDSYDNQTLQLNGKINLSENWFVKGFYRQHEADNDYDNCFVSATFATSDDCRSDSELDIWSVGIGYKNSVFSHELNASISDISREFFTEGELTFENEGEITQVEYLGSYTPQDSLKIVFGIDSKEEEIAFSERDQLAAFVNVQTQFNDHWFIDIGARYDDVDDFGEYQSFRLGSSYLITFQDSGILKFKASYGSGFRAPSLFEQFLNDTAFFGPAAGLQLDEETSKGYDLGVEWFSEQGWKLSLVWFDQTVEDFIEFDPVFFSGYLQSDDDATSQGVEVAFNWPVSESLELSVNHTYNDTETSNGQQRARRPENITNFSVIAQLIENLTLSSQLSFVSDAIDIDGEDLDNYSLLNITVNYAVTPELQVYSNVINALDDDYQEARGFNNGGIQAYVGARYSF
ncbi:TonB-dependent receptor [Sessilibacter sp. MAH1]